MQAGIFSYAWDLAAEGYDQSLARIADAGLTAVNLACAYHAGKFLLPHNPRHHIYFAEDGALYFQPNPARYGRIQPRVSSLVTPAGSPLTEIDAQRLKHGLDLVGWIVCLHNSWIGERYPDCTVHNAFGNPYWHTLSPAHPDVRDYLVAVLADIVSQAEVAAVELESPSYMGFLHGFHHEIIGLDLSADERYLLALSFSPSEMARAREAGIDIDKVRARVADTLVDHWNQERTPSAAQALAAQVEQLRADEDFAAYLALRDRFVAELIAMLRQAVHEASPSTEVRLFAALGNDPVAALPLSAVSELADGVLAGYVPSEDDARERTRTLRAMMGNKPIYGMVRAIAPDTTAEAQIEPRVAAWRAGGVAGIDFYNYGLMTLPMLAAVSKALDAS